MPLRPIYVARRHKHLEQCALQLEQSSVQEMLYELYVVRDLSLHEIATQLSVSPWSVRRYLLAAGITLRRPGGRNNIKVELTQELLDEVSRDGITAVAMRLGVDRTNFAAKLAAHRRRS